MWEPEHVEIFIGRSDGRLLYAGSDGKLEKVVTCSTVLIIEQRQGTGCDRGSARD